jgi:formate hydrogenlyase subunit 6/NADH:ubiquinone oxidoreductase subunit I
MRIGTMFWDVLRSLFRKPVTRAYPTQQIPTPERLRGILLWNPEQCTGCGLCAKDCPSDAIQLITIDKKNKQFVMRYDIGRCTFCAQCVQNCRFGCLQMSAEEWALAATSQEPFTRFYGESENVRTLLECEDAPDPAS